MIIALISGVLLVISLSVFTFTYSYQGLNKAIIFAPIEMLFNDVVYEGDEASFQRQTAIKKLKNYYSESLPRYCKSYTDSYYFYRLNDDFMCMALNCDGVEVTIDAEINLGYKYHRVMYYEISKGDHRG